jgi:hypothetical protein
VLYWGSMASSRHLPSILALYACGSWWWSCGGIAEDSSRPSGVAPTSAGETSTGGAASADEMSADAMSADRGSEALGGTPPMSRSVCEGDDPQLLPEGMRPHDECEGQPDTAPPTSPGDCVFWTGQGYLTAFSDSRGIVVASLGEDGVLLSEEVLATQFVGSVHARFSNARFSKNGDRVLIVLLPQGFAVLDLRGVPLTPLIPLAGEDYPPVFNFAVTASEDDWLVAFGYHNTATGLRGILLSRVSGDGVVLKQHDLEVWGYVDLDWFVPSGDGRAVLRGSYETGGQFGAVYSFVVVVDHELEAVSCTTTYLD